MTERFESEIQPRPDRRRISRLLVWGICSGVILVLALGLSITGQRARRVASDGEFLEDPTVRRPVREIWLVMRDELPEMGQPWLLELTYWVAIVAAAAAALGLLWLTTAPIPRSALAGGPSDNGLVPAETGPDTVLDTQKSDV